MFGLGRLFRKNPHEGAARDLYQAVVAQARAPAFYTDWGVPDTAEGRFDAVALHAFLVLRRLKREGKGAAPLAQAFFDHMFANMDVNLREMGVGDIMIARRIRRLAEAFYGRINAYETGLDTDGDGVLMEGLDRNLYAMTAAPEGATAAIAVYLRREDAALARQPIADLTQGRVSFGPVPARV